ncbi:hypothetical protein [Pseudofulvimonas gallinarii]|uniref:hypothetical protein n=1 Tax=Pseudofulvimonas gallinarii TaxID=634155 RepID=UPI00104FBBDA|nr:hypothetical protein [Pseudofulvimonas gallinarii]
MLAIAALGLSGVGAPAAQPLFSDGFEACCTVGGTVSGLSGSGLVLRLSAGAVSEDRAIAGNGSWSFSSPLANGVGYSVSVQNQPSPPCQIVNGNGTMGSAHVRNVELHCGASLKWNEGVWGDLWQ